MNLPKPPRELHPYLRYGLAVAMHQHHRQDTDLATDLTAEDLARTLHEGLSHFRLQPAGPLQPGNPVNYSYLSLNTLAENESLVQSSGLAEKGYFIPPTALIPSHKNAKNAYSAVKKLYEQLNELPEEAAEEELGGNSNLPMSIAAFTNKYNQGKNSQSNVKASVYEQVLAAISALTPAKAALYDVKYLPQAIFPALPLQDLKRYIRVFLQMKEQKASDLLVGQAKADAKKYPMPALVWGNFPDAPRRAVFGPAALLAAIGNWAKIVEDEIQQEEVLATLESLKNAPLYIVGGHGVAVESYSHHVVELAKTGKLSQILKGLWNTRLRKDENAYRYDDTIYGTFDLYAARFLQFFNPTSFASFLSYRADYHYQLEPLFTTYFLNKMSTPPEIVESARALGLWINRQAFFAAQKEAENRGEKSNKDETENRGEKSNKDDLYKLKAKFLTELESSIFNAKTEHQLTSQLISRVGRLTGQDAPGEGEPFITAVLTQDALDDDERRQLQKAKHLLITYARLRPNQANTAENADFEPVE